MVIIATELQTSWWKPWTRRTELVQGQNFQEAFANTKKLEADLPDYKFTKCIRVYSV